MEKRVLLFPAQASFCLHKSQLWQHLQKQFHKTFWATISRGNYFCHWCISVECTNDKNKMSFATYILKCVIGRKIIYRHYTLILSLYLPERKNFLFLNMKLFFISRKSAGCIPSSDGFEICADHSICKCEFCGAY